MDEDKDKRPLFQGIDEFERTYAPEELPADDPEAKLARTEGEEDTLDASAQVKAPAPPGGAISGTALSGEMVPPVYVSDYRRAPGDSESQTSGEEPPDDEV